MFEQQLSATGYEETRPLQGVVIGLGHQGMEHAQVITDFPGVDIVGVADPTARAHEAFRHQFPDHPAIIRDSAQTLLDDLDTAPDFGVIAVPHDRHLSMVQLFASLGIPVLKEKPLARNLAEVSTLLEIPNIERFCFTALQRRYSRLNREMPGLLSDVPSPRYFEYIYTLGLSDRTSGWRDNKLQAGGGTLLDMGYHIMGQIYDWFGPPDAVRTVLGEDASATAVSETELSSHIFLQYYETGLQGLVALTPVSTQKEESFQIFIPDGRRISGWRSQADLHTPGGETYRSIGTAQEDLMASQLADFIEHVRAGSDFADNLHHHQSIMRIIEMGYQSQLQSPKPSLATPPV
jgi:predicted dehydrogenase